MKLVTSEQMRALERKAVEAGTSLDELMQNAGLAVAQEVWLSLGVVGGRRIAVLCGPGNNGGDGLVAARHLAEWEGDVTVYLLTPRPADDPDLAKVRALDVPVLVATEDEGFAQLDRTLDGAEVIIDALLGTGRSRPAEGALAAILARVRRAGERPLPPRVLAVDLPTGVDADSGAADPLAVRATETITFGVAKVGLYTLPGSDHAGRVQVVDIGLPKDAERDVPTELLDTRWVRERLPSRPKDGNKGTFGKVLLVAGSVQYAGAARLAAEGVYRAGTGLVTLACSPRLQSLIAPALPEAIYVPLDDMPAITPAASDTIAGAMQDSDALLIGPGLSQAEGVRETAAAALHRAPERIRACVVDADALNALAATPEWQRGLARPCIFTPHPGEMARLLRTSVEAVQGDRLNVTVGAAATWGQVVVLKGAHTIVAAPDGRAAISPYANPLLATAGTGDVLAGIIAGLVAQGMEPFEAAACGVFIHGLAAEELGEEMGDRGLLASDLLPAIPRAIRTVREGKRAVPAPFAGGFGDLSAFAGALGGARTE